MRLIDADTLVKDLSYLYTKNHIPVDMRAKEILTTIRKLSNFRYSQYLSKTTI